MPTYKRRNSTHGRPTRRRAASVVIFSRNLYKRLIEASTPQSFLRNCRRTMTSSPPLGRARSARPYPPSRETRRRTMAKSQIRSRPSFRARARSGRTRARLVPPARAGPLVATAARPDCPTCRAVTSSCCPRAKRRRSRPGGCQHLLDAIACGANARSRKDDSVGQSRCRIQLAPSLHPPRNRGASRRMSRPRRFLGVRGSRRPVTTRRRRSASACARRPGRGGDRGRPRLRGSESEAQRLQG